MISESCTNLKINAVDELTDDSDSFIKNIQILRVQSTHRLKTEKMVRVQVFLKLLFQYIYVLSENVDITLKSIETSSTDFKD